MDAFCEIKKIYNEMFSKNFRKHVRGSSIKPIHILPILIYARAIVDFSIYMNQPGSTSTLLRNQNTTDFGSNASAVSTLPY